MRAFILVDPRSDCDDTIRIAVLGEEVPQELVAELEQKLLRVFQSYLKKIESTAVELVLYIKEHIDFAAFLSRLDEFVDRFTRTRERRYALATT